jgi:hypothetical protein
MSEATRSAAVGKFDVLVGEWELEAEFSGMEPMRGARSTFEWVLDGRFLLQRTEVPVAEAPDSLALVGVDPDSGSYLQHYYDSRGVARVYMMTMDDGVWQLFRDRADFSPLEFCQRFLGAFGDGGDVIRGAWEISEDGQDWRHDFTLTYGKISR